MSEAFICDAIRTPIGRYGGSLAAVRADDLAAIPNAALVQRHPHLQWQGIAAGQDHGWLGHGKGVGLQLETLDGADALSG